MKEQHAVVIAGSARFSLLADGLVRLEYAPSGAFEDRRSVRVIARPEAIPFEDVIEENGVHVLRGRKLTVRYHPDGRPFSQENLQVCDTVSGQPIWKPGQIDTKNLGGVHLAMDCIQRRVIPEGVHPATTDYHDNSERCQLWSYIAELTDKALPDAQYSGRVPTLEQLLATKKLSSLPSRVQELLHERSKYPPGLLSQSGYFLFNDSASPVLDSRSDWIEDRGPQQVFDYYLFFYGRDFSQALRDYRLLFGAYPLPPRYSFGLWYSRYPTFDEARLRKLIAEFEEHELPLDVLVLDLEWHRFGWFGYDWDRNHIQDPDGFLQFLREKGIHITLNLHPGGVHAEEPRFNEFIQKAGIDFDPKSINEWGVFSDFEFCNRHHADAFMNVLLKPIEQQGVDFWWVDGYVQCKSRAVDPQLWTNHLFRQHIERELPANRSMIFSRTAGFGSHRYPFHFTGDAYSQWEVLCSQVEYTLRAGHIGQSFVTHDIGGHISEHTYIDSDLFCRWVQFGVLSPIFRLHSSDGSERIPWCYGAEVLASVQKALRLRMELLPYLYTLARVAHEDCLPLCRSNCLAHPDWETGSRIWDAYYIGDRVYATPIVTPGDYRDVVLPKGRWYCGRTHAILESEGETPFPIIAAINEPPPHYIRAGTLLVKQPYVHRAKQIPDKVILEIYADKDMNDIFDLYEDDGVTPNGDFAWTHFSISGTDGHVQLEIGSATGAFAGQPRERCYEIRVIGLAEYKTITTIPLATNEKHRLTL